MRPKNPENKQAAKKEFEEQFAEKHDWHWALTGFAFESWRKSKKEMDDV
jgi:hypothetical protein